MDVSVIIVNYNTSDLVKNCITSIMEKTKNVSFEIIVVDNNSKDGSVETIINEFPQVRVFPLKENVGFGKANNIGVQHAKGRYVFFLNSDTVLLNDAISILANYLDTLASVALCGGQLFDKEENPTGSYLEYPKIKFFLSLVLRGNATYKELPIYPEGEIPYYISGADMMIRKSFIDKYGAFDPDFFMYYEDTELSYRVQHLGFGVHFVPRAQIIHLQDMSPKERGPVISALDLYVIQSRYLYLKKVMGINIMRLFLLSHLIKVEMALAYYALKKNVDKVYNWDKIKKMLWCIWLN